jgi:hypothetical protein
MLALGSLLAIALAAGPRLAVMPLTPGASIPPEEAASLTDAVAAELRQQSGAEVITSRDLGSLLSFEKQKAAVGCSSDTCMAELAGAVGAGRLVAGDVARLGESLLLQLRLLDVRAARVVAQSSRRFKKGSFDDLLDALPSMVRELLHAPPSIAGADRTAPPPTAARAEAAAAPAASAKAPRPAAEGPAFVLHLHRADGRYDGLRVVSWNAAADSAKELRSPPPGVLLTFLGAGDPPTGQDAFGAVWRLPAGAYPSGRVIFFTRKDGGWDECVPSETSKPMTPKAWILADGLEAWMNVPECELFATQEAAVQGRRKR